MDVASRSAKAEPDEGQGKLPVAAAAATASTDDSASQSPSYGRKQVVTDMFEEGMSFPEKLMELLNGGTDRQALWWLPEGKSFAIESKRFRKTILAENFQGSKFESFTRKLARWYVTEISTNSSCFSIDCIRHGSVLLLKKKGVQKKSGARNTCSHLRIRAPVLL